MKSLDCLHEFRLVAHRRECYSWFQEHICVLQKGSNGCLLSLRKFFLSPLLGQPLSVFHCQWEGSEWVRTSITFFHGRSVVHMFRTFIIILKKIKIVMFETLYSFYSINFSNYFENIFIMSSNFYLVINLSLYNNYTYNPIIIIIIHCLLCVRLSHFYLYFYLYLFFQ